VLTGAGVYAIFLAGCARGAHAESETKQAIDERINEICAMPEPRRTTELERLKKEAGVVLYCGNGQH